MRGLWFRTLTQNSKKKFMLLGLLDRPLVWFFAKMSVSCLSGHLSARLSPDICINFFFFFFVDFLHVARNIQKSRSISVEKGIIKINFQVFWKVLSFKFETIMKALIIFVFLFKTHFIYIQESYWLWYITQKCSQPIRMQDFLNLNTHEAMELWNYFFACDSTLLELTNRFSFSAWFLLVIPNFGLTNQDSKIVEIAITQEKSELLNYFFAYG